MNSIQLPEIAIAKTEENGSACPTEIEQLRTLHRIVTEQIGSSMRDPYALVQPSIEALAVFAALAIGVAAPFTLLCFCPPLARRLPRPGPWMVTLKHALAFPMLAAAAWLVWVLNSQMASAGLPLILGCALLLALTGWLYGLAQKRIMSGKPARGLTVAAASGLVAIAAAFALPGQALVASPGAASAMTAAAKPVADARPVRWSPERVARETAAGRPVFVDFSAAWCLTCQVNEKAVLSKPAFKEAIARTDANCMIAESTNYGAGIEKAMSDLGRTGLPLYLVYPAGGGDPVILPQLLTPRLVVDALNAAARKKCGQWFANIRDRRNPTCQAICPSTGLARSHAAGAGRRSACLSAGHAAMLPAIRNMARRRVMA